MNAGSVCSRLTEDGVVTAVEENGRPLVASRRASRLVEGVSWCVCGGGGGSVSRREHHWLSLMETLLTDVVLLSFKCLLR